MSLKKIIKNDKVIVITGKYKNKTGIVTRVVSDKNRAFVSGVNLVNEFNKGNNKGMEKKEASIHISNLSLMEQGTNKAVRVKVAVLDGKKIFVSKKTGKAVR
jgi:large subunit ribosomal protein L24